MSFRYTVTAPGGIQLPPDTVVKLEGKQLELRKHQVAPAKGKKGFFVSRQSLSFKTGETIETDAELSKALANRTDRPVAASKPTPTEIDHGVPAKPKPALPLAA